MTAISSNGDAAMRRSDIKLHTDSHGAGIALALSLAVYIDPFPDQETLQIGSPGLGASIKIK